MSEYLIQDTTLIEIANAIRNKTEKTEIIKVSNFAHEINSINIEKFSLPVLDAKYPEDTTVTILKGDTTQVNLNVSFISHGNPAVYTYQWYENGNAVEGATESSYTKTDLSSDGTYSIYCEVTNKKGTVTSRIATLKVTQIYTPTLNTSYPANATVEIGASVTNKVTIATDGNPTEYTYQWYKDGVKISGATNPSYTFTPTAIGSTKFYCEVTNTAGIVTSRTATITSSTAYFYNNGSVNTALTGGLSAVAQQHSSSTWPKYAEISYGSNYISLLHIGAGIEGQNRASPVYLNNEINLTNVRTISINVSLQGGDTYWSDAYLFVTNSKTTQIVNYIAKVSIEAVGNHVLDVSSLNGNYYVGIMLTGKGSCRIDFTEWKISS